MAENNTQENFNFKDFLNICLSKWYWFIISVVICLGIGVFYILKTPNVFTRTATIQIKETNNRRSASDLESVLGTGGLVQMNSKLSNELVAFRSPDLMREVVKRLSLDYNYSIPGRFKNHIAYGSNLPIKAVLTDFSGSCSFKVSQDSDSLYTVSGLIYYKPGVRKKFKVSDTYKVAAGDTVQTAVGGLSIIRSAACDAPIETYLNVGHTSIESATRRYTADLAATAVDMKNMSDMLNLSISDQSVEKASDILNTVLIVYNENWVEDRNMIAVSTSEFISDRLITIESELGNVDTDISSYKSKYVIPDVAAISNLYMTQSSETGKMIQDLENQVYSARYIRNVLGSSTNPFELIPASSTIANASISAQITQFNNMVLERNNLVAASSELNPLVVDMDESIISMRSSILASIDNQITTLRAQITNLQRTEQAATSRLADNPKQSQYLLSVERQQKVMEAIYLFLLQKREENELTRAFTAYNTRLVTKPTGSPAPTSPQKSKILLIAFLLGFCIPLGILYLQVVLNTKVRGRKDLENVSLPFVGEIPLYHPADEKFSMAEFLKLKKKNVDAAQGTILVSHGKRDVINEAFRVLRTNLEFMCKEPGCQVIAVTSFNAGSGKTFSAMNLAASLAIKGKKVLVVDGDLRHASTSTYVSKPSKGITDYIIGDIADYTSVIVKHPDFKTLEILPVGTIPPNPSELVGDKRFSEMIAALRDSYDYMFIDCPPVEIVADTQIIENVVDRTLFVVRAGLLERSMVPELEALSTSDKLKNVCLALNGTDSNGGRYGYGYRYGYHSYGDYYSQK